MGVSKEDEGRGTVILLVGEVAGLGDEELSGDIGQATCIKQEVTCWAILTVILISLTWNFRLSALISIGVGPCPKSSSSGFRVLIMEPPGLRTWFNRFSFIRQNSGGDRVKLKEETYFITVSEDILSHSLVQ